jgi:hypothetical protein
LPTPKKYALGATFLLLKSIVAKHTGEVSFVLIARLYTPNRNNFLAF